MKCWVQEEDPYGVGGEDVTLHQWTGTERDLRLYLHQRGNPPLYEVPDELYDRLIAAEREHHDAMNAVRRHLGMPVVD